MQNEQTTHKKFIDISDVVNLHSFENIKQFAVCSICTGILINPVQCVSCENCFCKSCISDWLSKSKSCPFKCKHTSFKESRLIKSLLEPLIVKCPNDCNAEVKYEDLQAHEQTCPKNLTNCPLCDSKINKIKLREIDPDDPNHINKVLKENSTLKSENEFLRKKHMELEVLIKFNNMSLETNKVKTR